MTENERDPSASARACAEAAVRLRARHGWQLLDQDELAQRALEQLLAGLASDAQRAVVYSYSLALHAACSGSQGRERQNLGYDELFRYLYNHARRRFADVCDDATQQALERIYRSFERCREPGAFLAFALQRLIDAARALRRKDAQQPLSLDAPAGAGSLGELLPDEQAPPPEARLEAADLRARVAEFSAAVRRRYPRASQQFDALWLKQFEGLDDDAIGQRLGRSVENVYVLRARALKKLRADPELRRLAGEFGLLDEE